MEYSCRTTLEERTDTEKPVHKWASCHAVTPAWCGGVAEALIYEEAPEVVELATSTLGTGREPLPFLLSLSFSVRPSETGPVLLSAAQTLQVSTGLDGCVVMSDATQPQPASGSAGAPDGLAICPNQIHTPLELFF